MVSSFQLPVIHPLVTRDQFLRERAGRLSRRCLLSISVVGLSGMTGMAGSVSFITIKKGCRT